MSWKDKENINGTASQNQSSGKPIKEQTNKQTKNSRQDSSLVLCKMIVVSAITVNIYHEKKYVHNDYSLCLQRSIGR